VQVALLFVLAAAFALVFGRGLVASTAGAPALIHLGAVVLLLCAAGIAVVTFTATVRWLLRRR